MRAVILLSIVLALASCGSRLNPFNWFGGDREQRVRVDEGAVGDPVVADPRSLVFDVTSVAVEQTTSGAIVRASGLTEVQGYFAVSLVEVERTETDLVYEFRAAPPLGPSPQGVPRSREVFVAEALSVGELAGIRTITVIGQANRRTVTRR